MASLFVPFPLTWYRHLQAAGLVGKGVASGMNMHRARHTFATDLCRVADLGAASQALGHSDLSTPAAIYGHYDLSGRNIQGPPPRPLEMFTVNVRNDEIVVRKTS